MFFSALSKPDAKRKTSFTLACLMIYLYSFFLSSKTIHFLQTWFYSIYMLASRRVPKAHEVLNKHQQNQHEFQHGVKQPLSQKISFRIGTKCVTGTDLQIPKPGRRDRKVPQDWVMLGKQLLFPLCLSQPEILFCLSCQPKYRPPHTQSQDGLCFGKSRIVRWLSESSYRKTSCRTKVMKMEKEQIKQPCLRVTSYDPVLPLSVLSNLNSDIENKGQACSYFPAQRMPHNSYLELTSTPDNYLTFLKC